MAATVLPRRRLIESARFDIDMPEEEAREILAAIHAGQQIMCHTFTRGLLADMAKEVCLTSFTDPRTGLPRWAVEVWAGSKKWTRDYGSQEAAESYAEREMDRLGI